MILYVDETENEEYFIVTGLLMPSKEDTDLAYKKFKNKVADYPIRPELKTILFTEFKSTLMDRFYPRLKIKMLEEIVSDRQSKVYSCAFKKTKDWTQERKESVYIKLLKKITSNIECNFEIIFDTFNKYEFEKEIISNLSIQNNIINIQPKDSRKEPGLQFADNLCSVVRRKITNSDKRNFYDIIKDRIKIVDKKSK